MLEGSSYVFIAMTVLANVSLLPLINLRLLSLYFQFSFICSLDYNL